MTKGWRYAALHVGPDLICYHIAPHLAPNKARRGVFLVCCMQTFSPVTKAFVRFVYVRKPK